MGPLQRPQIYAFLLLEYVNAVVIFLRHADLNVVIRCIELTTSSEKGSVIKKFIKDYTYMYTYICMIFS